MIKKNRIICQVPGKLKELINSYHKPIGVWHIDKSNYAALVKAFITFPAKFTLSPTDPELEKVIRAIEKKEVEEVGLSFGDFDFKHLKNVSELNFRSITQQSSLALCSMAVYIKKNKIKSYQVGENLKITFNSN